MNLDNKFSESMFVGAKYFRVKIIFRNRLINDKRINIQMKGWVGLNASCKVKKAKTNVLTKSKD